MAMPHTNSITPFSYPTIVNKWLMKQTMKTILWSLTISVRLFPYQTDLKKKTNNTEPKTYCFWNCPFFLFFFLPVENEMKSPSPLAIILPPLPRPLGVLDPLPLFLPPNLFRLPPSLELCDPDDLLLLSLNKIVQTLLTDWKHCYKNKTVNHRTNSKVYIHAHTKNQYWCSWNLTIIHLTF